MRLGSDLRSKALLALEEAAQRSRYHRVRQSYALRFALAYLWSLNRGDPGPYRDFWKALQHDGRLHRIGHAETALKWIYRDLGVPRDDAIAFHFWGKVNEEERLRSKGGEA